MAPKKGRVGGQVTAQKLTMVFRGHFRTLQVGDFAAEVEDVVDSCPLFLFDVLKLDPYPSEKVLMTAMSAAFPELDCKVRTMAKQLKCVLNHVNQKKRSRKSGAKLHDNTNNILCWLEKAQMDSQEDSLPAPVVDEPAPVVDEPAVELDPLLSQLTVNSSVDSEATLVYSDEEPKGPSPLALDSRPEKAKAESTAQFWDHGRCTMVRIWPAASAGEPLEELATMKLGFNGFLQACFGDEEPINTEHANVLLTPKPKTKAGKVCKRPAAAVLKRPASAVLKRPAKASKGLAVQQLAVEEQLVPVQQMAEEPELDQGVRWPPVSFYVSLGLEDLKFQMPSGTWIKIGLFGDQSYITTHVPGEAKWPYLVGVSAKAAARNGKHHHSIIRNIWNQLKLMREVPTKGFCKALVLQLQAE
jgi:hypothetical protein